MVAQEVQLGLKRKIQLKLGGFRRPPQISLEAYLQAIFEEDLKRMLELSEDFGDVAWIDLSCCPMETEKKITKTSFDPGGFILEMEKGNSNDDSNEFGNLSANMVKGVGCDETDGELEVRIEANKVFDAIPEISINGFESRN
ncbi:hypothetical protein ACH5RR_032326 [Cinchona calisaya]|uniref:Uncharacterized protein n=1 Tax=Cinchona calisaya TaxID=153742 RepID=A0ABD2YKD8_9GENT